MLAYYTDWGPNLTILNQIPPSNHPWNVKIFDSIPGRSAREPIYISTFVNKKATLVNMELDFTEDMGNLDLEKSQKDPGEIPEGSPTDP